MYRCSVILNEKYRFIHTQNKWERLSLALIKTPLQYWYLCTVQTQGIRNTEQFSFAMHNLKGTKMGALFLYFHHLLCVSADFADLWNPLSLCLLLWFPSVSQIYDFELGTMGAVTIGLTPHSFFCWRAKRLVRMRTLAQVWWLAVRQMVNWKVNIKLGRNEVSRFRDGIASECEEQTGVGEQK